MDLKQFDAISQRLTPIGDRRRLLGAIGLLTVAVPASEDSPYRCRRIFALLIIAAAIARSSAL